MKGLKIKKNMNKILSSLTINIFPKNDVPTFSPLLQNQKIKALRDLSEAKVEEFKNKFTTVKNIVIFIYN